MKPEARTFTPIAPSPADALNLLSISSEHRIRSENLPFDIDVWYPRVKDFTFETAFLPLSLSEAQAIVNYYETFYNHRMKLSSEHVHMLKSLERRIEAELRTNQAFACGAFLRLCGRSPKDGEPLNRSQVLVKYNKDLEELYLQGAPRNANTKLRAIAKSTYLRVTTGAEAMSLLLTSERVFTDLQDWLRFGGSEQIVLRRWHEGMSLEYEFRVFVNHNKITAISQYDHYCEYPDLVAIKDQVQSLIIEKWSQVHQHIGQESYVIDFSYDPNKKTIVMIELSPFRTCTGTAMFSWSQDQDQLHNGPLEFRIKTEMHPYIKELVEVNWEDRWNAHVERYDSIYHKYQETTTWMSWLLSFFYRKTTIKDNFIFVYGTLKKGFHWHDKFLSTATFVGRATSVNKQALVVDDFGVPHLLNVKGGESISGEVWRVDEEALSGLDDYEGVNKEYYSREPIEVRLDNGSVLSADAYYKVSAGSLAEGPFISEYTKSYHDKHYNPIKHAHAKQLQYLESN
ncbi:gamma-glutamylcyclotransferase [Acrasis kona]|uniref:Gamma-glutamylcyclotransferase n=1 Tax=Acrasis kona TaxID=1008807 RepID=A0AAW2YHD3_9EUKA